MEVNLCLVNLGWCQANLARPRSGGSWGLGMMMPPYAVKRAHHRWCATMHCHECGEQLGMEHILGMVVLRVMVL